MQKSDLVQIDKLKTIDVLLDVVRNQPIKDKQLLIDAICGKGFSGSLSFAMDMENFGLAKFTGNQHNQDWTWDRNALEQLSIEELDSIYKY